MFGYNSDCDVTMVLRTVPVNKMSVFNRWFWTPRGPEIGPEPSPESTSPVNDTPFPTTDIVYVEPVVRCVLCDEREKQHAAILEDRTHHHTKTLDELAKLHAKTLDDHVERCASLEKMLDDRIERYVSLEKRYLETLADLISTTNALDATKSELAQVKNAIVVLCETYHVIR